MCPVSRLSGRPAHSISTVCVLNMLRSQFESGCGRAGPDEGDGSRPWRCVNLRTECPQEKFASPADAEAIDELLIAILVSGLDVIEQPAPLAHHFEQAAPRMIVLVMSLKVLGEIGDPLRQDSDLDFGGTGISRLGGVFLNKLLLALSADRHRDNPLIWVDEWPGQDVVQHGRLKVRKPARPRRRHGRTIGIIGREASGICSRNGQFTWTPFGQIPCPTICPKPKD